MPNENKYIHRDWKIGIYSNEKYTVNKSLNGVLKSGFIEAC